MRAGVWGTKTPADDGLATVMIYLVSTQPPTPTSSSRDATEVDRRLDCGLFYLNNRHSLVHVYCIDNITARIRTISGQEV